MASKSIRRAFNILVIAAPALALGAAPPADAGAELPDLPVFASDGGVLDVRVTTRVEDGVRIGLAKVDGLHSIAVGCAVEGTACTATPGSEGIADYAGAVLKLAPNDELKIAVENGVPVPVHGMAMPGHCMSGSAAWDPLQGWKPEENLFNLHMHGLLVSPYRHADGDYPVLGDDIFDCTHGQGETLRYDMVLGSRPGSGVPDGTTQPQGVNWFHPHVHGIAKAQVSSGMAGMIVVDGGGGYTDETHAPVVWRRERNILLKDIQLVQPNPARHWLAYADENPDFCGANKLSLANEGFCRFDPAGDAAGEIDQAIFGDAGGPLTERRGRWVFTLNGAVDPTITVAAPEGTDYRELWRVQNASANVTYRLTLRPVGGTEGGPVLDAPFEVLSLDGGAAAGPTGGAALAPLSREVLLMPGARAELAVGRPDHGLPGADPTATLRYQLVDEAFQAGFGPDTADTWPRVALADVTFKGAATATASAGSPSQPGMTMHLDMAPSIARIQPPFEAAAAPQIPIAAARIELRSEVVKPPAMALRRATLRSFALPTPQPDASADGPSYDPAAVSALCSDLSQIGFDPSTTMRRIYFAIAEGDGAERFLLGETFVNATTGAEFDGKGHPVPPNGKVRLSTFDAASGFCALRVSDPRQAETWELVNLSPEVHNFHVHQMKFTAARDRNGNIELRAPSELDRVNLIDKLLLTSGPVELTHDTIVVPRGNEACDNATSQAITMVSPPSDDPYAARVFELDRAVFPAHAACTGDGRPGDGSGMLRINLAFAGAQFAAYKEHEADATYLPASFVFHCHILEHEDNGMMARMTVLDPALLTSP